MIRFVLLFGLFSFSGCDDDASTSSDMHALASDMSTVCTAKTDGGKLGGPVGDSMDSHCIVGGAIAPTTVNMSSCMTDAAADSGAGDYGDTMYGTTGYDDDCKYLVSFTVDPVCENEEMTFTVTAKYATNLSMPVTGAKIQAEVETVDLTHPTPSIPSSTESTTTPGTYTITPIKFDRSGRWLIRFHLFEDCSDALDDSPHGHAAFFIDVP